jgi:non-heme chloroperoxidase
MPEISPSQKRQGLHRGIIPIARVGRHCEFSRGPSEKLLEVWSVPFHGANRPGAQVSQGLRDFFWMQGMLAGLQSSLRLHQGAFRNGP